MVAGRGEIAVRIFDTLRQMGIATVAVYTATDAGALHARQADERFLLRGDNLTETYLDIRKLIGIALESGVDAIHPGYGFLSEEPEFAKAVREAGLIFIGPGEDAIRLMGNKAEARMLAGKLGIPVIEGVTGNLESLDRQAGKLGYPLLVKAAAGGGGKGMRRVESAEQLSEALEATRREAGSYFGNPEVYLEKLLPSPRHIEVQLLGDQHGQLISLYERECSLQRRHQKVIEESPAPNLSAELRRQLVQAAIALGSHIGYYSAGTVEFLVQGKDFFFLEMNTRIQVEHPVTEMITGIDMVREQIRIASGQPLSFSQDEVSIHGHAIEARVYAEDPQNDFRPCPGKVLMHKLPTGDGLRIDTSLDGPGEISSLFDPMISKVICHASGRETARKKLIRYLKDYVILGITTNQQYLLELLSSASFVQGKSHTGQSRASTKKTGAKSEKVLLTNRLLAVAFLFANGHKRKQGQSAWQRIGFWRLLPQPSLLVNGKVIKLRLVYYTHDHLGTDDAPPTSYRLIMCNDYRMQIEVGGSVHILYYLSVNGALLFQYNGFAIRVSPERYLTREILSAINENPVLEGEHLVRSPMHGKVVRICVDPGKQVNRGDTLLILESMKMENKIAATAKAFVKKIEVNEGDMVEDNAPLICLSNKVR